VYPQGHDVSTGIAEGQGIGDQGSMNFGNRDLVFAISPKGLRRWLIALSQVRPYLAATPRSQADGARFGRLPGCLGAFRRPFFDAVERA
jgi:hypothetical protein